jgi:hypothetical protein
VIGKPDGLNSVVPEWMDKQIWPQIWSMIVNDAYFRVFEQAREITGKFKGHIAQLVHDGYLTSQMIAIRRLCDEDKTVISLHRVLIETRRKQPADAKHIDQLLKSLKSCDHVCRQASEYIAHTANPARGRKVPAWNMQMKHLTEAHEAICRSAIVLDRDILRRKALIGIVPVYQGDIMEDFRHWVPEDDIKKLLKLWHAHLKKVDDWARHPYG